MLQKNPGRNGKETVGFKESDFLSEGGILGWRKILSKGVCPYAPASCQFLFSSLWESQLN